MTEGEGERERINEMKGNYSCFQIFFFILINGKKLRRKQWKVMTYMILLIYWMTFPTF